MNRELDKFNIDAEQAHGLVLRKQNEGFDIAHFSNKWAIDDMFIKGICVDTDKEKTELTLKFLFVKGDKYCEQYILPLINLKTKIKN